VQVVEPQLVPDSYFLQPPLPSQSPFRLQVAAPSSGHSLSGSESSAMFSQVPSAPAPFFAAVQAWQLPVQGESQHTPSTQFPLTHCDAPEQDRPLARSDWQVWSLARQNAFATQSLSLEQVVAHEVALAQK
jgi:hypothetical protein